MPGYLDNYAMAVANGQLKAINRVLDTLRREGLVDNEAQLAELTEQLRKKVTNTVTFEPVLDPNRIRSQDLNDNFLNIFVDLFGLYEHLTRMDATLRSQKVVSRGLRQTIRKALHRLEQDLKQFYFLRSNPDYTEVKYVDFTDVRNLSTDVLRAVVEPNSRTLRLPPIRQDRHTELRGSQATTMSAEVLTDAVVGASVRSFKPDNALDQDLNSFWAEAVLADGLVQSTYTRADGTQTTLDGVIVKVTIAFEKPEFVNNIQVLPYGCFPTKILDIRIDGGSWDGYTDIPSSFDWMDFTGTRTVAESVDIYLLQENYKIGEYLVPRTAYRNAQFWDRVVDEDLQLRFIEEAQIGMEVRNAYTKPESAGIIRTQTDLKDILDSREYNYDKPHKRARRVIDAIGDVLEAGEIPLLRNVGPIDTTDDRSTASFIEIDKFEYLVGAFSIVTSDVQYEFQGSYESPRFQVQGLIDEVELEVYDVQSDDTGFNLTSVEYDIMFGDDVALPIIPYGTGGVLPTGINQEWLAVDPNSQTGYIRFEPSIGTTGTVYKNHVAQPTAPFTSASRAVGITGNYDPDAIYTIDYIPSFASTPETIDVESELDSRPKAEIFTESDGNGRIQLASYPYIIWDIVNDETRWHKPDEKQGIWRVDPSGVALYYDGFSYGDASSVVDGGDISASATTVDLSDASNFPSQGVIKLQNEFIKYGGKSSNTLQSLIRGWESTIPVAHTAGTTGTLVTLEEYEPIKVTVNGRKAANISDYKDREHPAFANVRNENARFEYVHIGRNLYLSQPVQDATVEVEYRSIADFVGVRSTLRNHQLGEATRTPVVNRFAIRMKTEKK